MTSNSTESLDFINTKMKALAHIYVLHNILLSCVKNQALGKLSFYKQDNGPKHTVIGR